MPTGEVLYQTIFEATGSAMCVIDEDTSVLRANNEFARLVGLSKDAIENKKKWTDFFHKNDVARMLEYHYARREATQTAPRNYESRLIDVQGNVYYVYATVEVIPGTKKSVASFINITKTKDAEHAFYALQRQQEALLNNISDMAWLKDQEGRYLAVNQAMASMYKRTTEEFCGKTNFDFISHDIAKKHRDDDVYVMQTKAQKRIVEPLEELEEHDIWVEKIKTPVYDESGAVVGIVGIARDITEFKKNHEQLMMAKKNVDAHKTALEKKNIALQEILTHIEEEKNVIKRGVVAHVEQFLLPSVIKMKQSPALVSKKRLELLEENLKDIVQSFYSADNEKTACFTPKEIEICNMIRHGFSSKEIARELKLSYDTVETHRKNIRKKLKLNGAKINLSVYLQKK